MSIKTFLFSCLTLSNLANTYASVAIGLGTLNPVDPTSCLDPETGKSHPLGVSWNSLTSCGEARCDLRHGTVYISYSYCGAASAGEGCYLKRDLSMPFPYCCPRSFCPSNRITDIFSNSLDGDYPEEELQMAANQVQDNTVVVAAPTQYETSLDSDSQEYDEYDWDKIFGGYFK